MLIQCHGNTIIAILRFTVLFVAVLKLVEQSRQHPHKQGVRVIHIIWPRAEAHECKVMNTRISFNLPSPLTHAVKGHAVRNRTATLEKT